MKRFGRHLAPVALALGLVIVHSAAAGAGSAPRVARTQKLTQLMTPHGVRARPDGHAAVIETVQPWRPLTGERTILPVLARARGKQGVWWLEVLLPGRPNGHTGWIKKPGTLAARTSFAVVVHLAKRRVDVYHSGRLVESFLAVVGGRSTPTPRGQFFVEEWLQITPGSAGGPYALALSARSNVYQEFDGGPGQIALHGIYGIGGKLGTAQSHGCIRLDSAAMTWLGTHIHGGVPVTVTS